MSNIKGLTRRVDKMLATLPPPEERILMGLADWQKAEIAVHHLTYEMMRDLQMLPPNDVQPEAPQERAACLWFQRQYGREMEGAKAELLQELEAQIQQEESSHA